MGTANGNGTALKSRETQYQFEVDLALRDGFSRFGIMSNQTWKDDPRRLQRGDGKLHRQAGQ